MTIELLEEIPEEIREHAETLLWLLEDTPHKSERVVLSVINGYCGGDIDEIQTISTAALLLHFANTDRKATA